MACIRAAAGWLPSSFRQLWMLTVAAVLDRELIGRSVQQRSQVGVQVRWRG